MRPMIEDETPELNLFGDVHKYPLAFAVGAPIVGSILQVWIWWSLFRIPEGTAIRPMLQSMQSLMVDAGTVLLGAIGSLELARTHRRRLLGCALGLLSFAPFLIGILLVRWICTLKHLTFAP